MAQEIITLEDLKKFRLELLEDLSRCSSTLIIPKSNG